MDSVVTKSSAALQREIIEFTAVLQQRGVHEALQFLNSRTPHRYTGVFRFDGDMLRNEALYDRYQPQMTRGADAPLSATYCSLVGHQQAPLVIQDATTDVRVLGRVETPVVSYCGVPIYETTGRPFGTLCHYDMQRCQARATDLPLLQAAAQMLYQQLWPSRAAVRQQ